MSLFNIDETPKKCRSCLLHKKNIKQKYIDNTTLYSSGNPDVLIILEAVESDYLLRDFVLELKKNNIRNFIIKSGLNCSVKHYNFPNPIYKIYKDCGVIKEEDNYKVILTVGSGINSITNTSDINSWMEFSEFKFNDTYFLTGIEWKRKLRVYPIPNLTDWLTKDNFEYSFVRKQLAFITKYLMSFSERQTKIPTYNYEIIEEPNDFLKKHMHETELALDTETTGLDLFMDDFKIHCITISFDGVTGYFLPFNKIDINLLSNFLKGKKQYYANGKFDMSVLECKGVKNIVIDEDVITLFHVLSTMRSKNGLKILAWHLGLGGYEEKLDMYFKRNRGITWKNVPLKALYEYAPMDAIVTFRAVKKCLKLADRQPEVYKAYKDYLIPVIPVFKNMEMNGLEVNLNYLNELHDKLEEKKTYLRELITEELEIENIDSSQQLGRALEELGWSCQGRGKLSWTDINLNEHYYYKVGEPQLLAWKKEGHKLAETILEYRGINTLDKTFVGFIKQDESEKGIFNDEEKVKSEKGLVQYIQDDGKIHGTINPAWTDTWRAKSNGPNLQNQPKQGDIGKLFRPVFKCPEDYLFCEADYSGFQLRIGAIYSGDETMRDIFLNRGGDMHSITAQSIFCRDISLDEFLSKSEEEPFKSYRFKAKGVNFGFIFGRSANAFKSDLEETWTDSEIEEYIDKNELDLLENREGMLDKYLTVADDIRTKFFNTYRGLEPWIKDQHLFAERQGNVVSWHNVRRHTPYITRIGEDSNMAKVSNWKNIAVNSPVQAMESIEIYKALIEIDKKMKSINAKSKLIASVHDSIVAYIHKDEIKEMLIIFKDAMSNYEYDIPIEMEAELGTVWGFGTKVNYKNLNESISDIVKKYNI